MSKNLDPMDLKQIITLHLDGLSNRKIGETLGISRNTINRYLQLFKGSEYTLEELLKFDQAALREQFSVKTYPNGGLRVDIYGMGMKLCSQKDESQKQRRDDGTDERMDIRQSKQGRFL